MNDPLNSNAPEPRKIGVWTEGPPVEARNYVMPKKSSESIDDIPTIPDLDDLQDILEKEISKPPVPDHQDTETVNTLAEVGVSGSVEGIDAALDVLKSFIPEAESDTADTVWTIDSLLTQLAEEEENTAS
ncbi:intraflagellar transport protein 43 homolog [Vanessa atalanta]|uniref:intraflagellar transport protein 43 homolog n=1 Tax=Vanessa atalanta TaxID=42275 RepID=UPI001FCD29B4|nr:intraflagellar transport protein 43 homolog [Vanessa atalanta]